MRDLLSRLGPWWEQMTDWLAPALELYRMGLWVFPAAYREKATVVKWQDYQTGKKRVTEQQLRTWFSSRANYWVLCGQQSGVAVLDCDNAETIAWWQERIGREGVDLRTIPCVKTAKGAHFYFAWAEAVSNWSYHEDGLDFEVRSGGRGGVVAPPSVHESGHVYEWRVRPATNEAGRAAWSAAPAPLGSRQAAGLAGGTDAPSSGGGASSGGGEVRSMLAKLLANPPDAGGRNIWLSKVAGHYAARWRDAEFDAYEGMCRSACLALAGDPEEYDFTKTIRSIWETEHRKPDLQAGADGPQTPDRDNGWLVRGRGCLLTERRIKVGDKQVVELQPWSDFDIVAVGVTSDELQRVYSVRLVRGRQGDEVDALLPADTLVDRRKLNAWLGAYGLGIAEPEGCKPLSPGAAERLRLYLEGQKPARFELVRHYGWSDSAEAFVTEDGLITRAGKVPLSAGTVRPEPSLPNLMRFNYGMSEEVEALEVLREVLTFQDPTVCAVFGAWWAACLLKPQIRRYTSMWPIMAIEAASGVGKTNGFFALMLQLNGVVASVPTGAAARDAMSVNHSGVVWIDDPNDLERYDELLRAVTSGTPMSKKAADRTHTTTIPLVAPVAVSGEALGLGDQKAMRDRSIVLGAPSPVNRRSLNDRSRPQWDDIVALKDRYQDLSAHAGRLVAVALGSLDALGDLG